MRLIIKARSHKHIKKWRGKDGKWNYEYPKVKKDRKPAAEKPIKKERSKTPTDDTSLQPWPEGKELRRLFSNTKDVFTIPRNLIYGQFNVFGHTFAVHKSVTQEGEIVKGEIAITEMKTGLGAGHYNNEDVPDVAKAAIKFIGDKGKKEIDHLVNNFIEEHGNVFDSDIVAIDFMELNKKFEAELAKEERYEAEWEADREEKEKIESMSGSGLEDVAEYDTNKAAYYNLPPEEARLAAKTGNIIGAKALGGGVNGTYRCQMENGGDSEGVWKPNSQENHFIRRGEIPNDFYIREAAAYMLDQLLGFNLVPPTYVREMNGEKGSMQLFAQDAVLARDTDWSGRLSEEDKMKGAILDVLMYNTDRHYKNFMLGDNNELYLIDNGLCFPIAEGLLISELLGDLDSYDIPEELLTKMQEVDLVDLITKFEGIGMDEAAIDGMMIRWSNILGSGGDLRGFQQKNKY